MFKEGLANDQPKLKNLVIVILDGWSLTPQTLNYFFHRNTNPFFRSLLINFRALPFAKKSEHHPQKTFLAGKEVFNRSRLMQDIQAPKNFWQNSKIIQASDSLKKSGGRLWFLNSSADQSFNELVNFSRQNGLTKIGLYLLKPSKDATTLDKTPDDLLIASSVNCQQFRLMPEDILIYFCDLAEIDRFKQAVNRQKYHPLRSYVLTDDQESELLEVILENKLSPNLKEILLNEGLNIAEIYIDPTDELTIDNKAEVIFSYLPVDYFDFELPARILSRRREHLVRTIKRLLHQPDYQVVLTSRLGRSEDFELLPFILTDSKAENSNEIFSPIEEFLTSGYTIADVAPTILDLLDLKKSVEMTGKSMLQSLYPEKYYGDHLPLGQRLPASTPRSMFE